MLAGSALLNLLLLAGFSLDTGHRVREKFVSHNPVGPEKVAIISVKGLILGGDNTFVKRQIDQAGKDKTIKAIVLRIDSPGGTVSGSDYYYHHLRKLAEGSKVPMVVSMGAEAASGGYYIAMAVGPVPDVIFAEPTTWTGSIGVIIPHYNLGQLLGKCGVEEDSVVSGALKNMGSLSRPMTDAERKIFQSLVDDSFRRFKSIVQHGRPKLTRPADLDHVATGQVFTAEQAKQNGLVDQIGFLEDAVERAITLARIDPDQARVIKYEPEPSLFGSMLGFEAKRGGVDLPELVADLTSPQAYYLSTRLPLLVSTSGRE
jgi:protease-4